MSFDPLKRREIDPDRLRLVASSEQFQDNREPPLRLGDVVQLNSGGPRCLVVDTDEDNIVTIAWQDSSGIPQEHKLPRACVHRIDITAT